VKRPILASLAAATLSLGLLGSAPAQAATSHSPTAATMHPADDLDLPELAVHLLDRVTDALFHDHDGDHDGDDDGDHHDRDRDDDGHHRRSRCSGVISVCLG
jgi:hypothetical protein